MPSPAGVSWLFHADECGKRAGTKGSKSKSAWPALGFLSVTTAVASSWIYNICFRRAFNTFEFGAPKDFPEQTSESIIYADDQLSPNFVNCINDDTDVYSSPLLCNGLNKGPYACNFERNQVAVKFRQAT